MHNIIPKERNILSCMSLCPPVIYLYQIDFHQITNKLIHTVVTYNTISHKCMFVLVRKVSVVVYNFIQMSHHICIQASV